MNTFLMKPKIDFAFKEIMNDEKARTGFLAAVLHPLDFWLLCCIWTRQTSNQPAYSTHICGRHMQMTSLAFSMSGFS